MTLDLPYEVKNQDPWWLMRRAGDVFQLTLRQSMLCCCRPMRRWACKGQLSSTTKHACQASASIVAQAAASHRLGLDRREPLDHASCRPRGGMSSSLSSMSDRFLGRRVQWLAQEVSHLLAGQKAERQEDQVVLLPPFLLSLFSSLILLSFPSGSRCSWLRCWLYLCLFRPFFRPDLRPFVARPDEAMQSLSGYLEDAYIKWLGSSLACCGMAEKPPVRGE